MKFKKSAKTFVKFIGWTAVGAVVTAVAGNLGDVLNLFSIPATWQPIIATAVGGLLKSWATYAATEAKEAL